MYKNLNEPNWISICVKQFWLIESDQMKVIRFSNPTSIIAH